MVKRTLSDIDVKQRRVLVRVDFNVPVEQGLEVSVCSDHRIRQTLPTIQYLRDQGSRVILCSHLGRPNGKVVEGLRMAPVGQRLAKLLSAPVQVLDDCIGLSVHEAVRRMAQGDVVLLENLRFYPGEEANDPQFARSLASLADIFVSDAFAVAHRAHASIIGVPQYLPAAAGLLLQQEMEHLAKAVGRGQGPVGALLGGAKVSGKMLLLENMLGKVDHICIGGTMASTFLKGQGHDMGASEVEEDHLEFAERFLRDATAKGVEVLLPEDLVVGERVGLDPGRCLTVGARQVPPGYHVGDVGPETASSFVESLKRCKTIIWNGPVGVFEYPAFRSGTETLAKAIASMKAITIVGGGSTVEAVEALGLSEKMTHVSTGGGATLEFLEGKELPGIAALPDK